ncbi:hypothetical protein FGB62_37g47 [Gracilaria domingensis]|nr:hypothetical protein FGB62_37g47 [Gracilaria domingensis]
MAVVPPEHGACRVQSVVQTLPHGSDRRSSAPQPHGRARRRDVWRARCQRALRITQGAPDAARQLPAAASPLLPAAAGCHRTAATCQHAPPYPRARRARFQSARVGRYGAPAVRRTRAMMCAVDVGSPSRSMATGCGYCDIIASAGGNLAGRNPFAHPPPPPPPPAPPSRRTLQPAQIFCMHGRGTAHSLIWRAGARIFPQCAPPAAGPKTGALTLPHT